MFLFYVYVCIAYVASFISITSYSAGHGIFSSDKIYCFLSCFVFMFRPELFSWDKVIKMPPVERLEHAFSIAKNHLGIEKLLDPEGGI